ncbi:MAG: nucleotidyl transferase AbiEii/AbiGii toxin family protein [Candidatus Methylomirabilia bacterium]
MIPRADITAWRAGAPWSNDAQVEQDLVLSRALIDIFSDPLLARELAFRGGTALHKLYVEPPARYSDDIDLVQIPAGPIGAVLDALRARLDRWLGKPRRDRGEGRVSLFYRFTSEIPPITPLRLKVEINTREHFVVFGLHKKRLAVNSRWFAGEAPLVTYAPDELLGTKMRALYQRKKGRDLFDLSIGLDQRLVDPANVVKSFGRYMEEEGLSVSRAEFEANLAKKINDAAFRNDTVPLLRPAVSYDAVAAYERVQRELIALLPGEPWKGTGAQRP